MKKYKSLLLVVLMLCSTFYIQPAYAEENKELRILFLGSLHGQLNHTTSSQEEYTGGIAAIRSVFDTYRNENTIALASANSIAGNIYDETFATDTPAYTMLSRTGVDVIAVGKDDLSLSKEGWKKIRSESDRHTDFLATDLEEEVRDRYSIVKDVIQKDVNGTSVALFSLNAESGSFKDAEKKAREAVKSVEEDSDIVIGLLQDFTLDEAHDFAKKISDIDVLCVSSEDTKTIRVQKEGSTSIIAAGENGAYVGVLNLSGRKVSSYELVDVNQTVPENPEISAELESYRKLTETEAFTPYGIKTNTVLAKNSVKFKDAGNSFEADNMADLVAEAYASSYHYWYDAWYDDWRAERNRRLKAAERVAEAKAKAEAEEAQNAATPEEQDAQPEKEEEDPLITQVKALKPDMRETAIGIVSSDDINGVLPEGNVTISSVYAMSGNQNLVLFFLKGSDIRKLCEYDATIARKDESASALFFANLYYTYNDYRMDYNHVSEVYIDAINDYYVPISNDTFYPMVTNMELAKRIQNLDGEFAVTMCDKNGYRLNSFSSYIIETDKEVNEKQYSSIASYITNLERDAYGKAEISTNFEKPFQGKRKETEFKVWNFIKNTSSHAMRRYIAGILVVLLGYVGIRVIKHASEKKRKSERGQNNE